jgi:hypothetical protein
MNYVDDDWMNELTAGQKERVWAQIGMFRMDLLSGQTDEEAGFKEAGEAVIW